LPAINIDPGYGRSIHDTLAHYLSHHGVTVGHIYPSSNPLMSINLVAAGLGYTLLPAYAENFMPKDVISRPLSGDLPMSELLMVSPRDASASTRLRIICSSWFGSLGVQRPSAEVGYFW
jgi:LysR family hca operon transcriptional activator